MNLPLPFYLSLGSLLFAVVVAVYFFQEWWAHHRHHPFFLYWAVGALLLYLLQVPYVLANLGVRFNLWQFNGFYALTLPLAFGGALLIYLGLLMASGRRLTSRLKLWVSLWFAAALVTYAYFFILERGEMTSHASVYLSTFGFFMPLYFLHLVASLRWFVELKGRCAFACLGVVLLVLFGVGGAVSRGMLFWRVTSYPPQQWFFAVANYEALFLVRLAGLVLLLVSFVLIHYSWHRGRLTIDHPYT